MSPHQRADQQGEGQRQRPHGAGGQQERPEHSHSGDPAGAGAGAKLWGAVCRDLCQNQTGNAETASTFEFSFFFFFGLSFFPFFRP